MPPVLAYLARRLLMLVPILFGISLIVFGLMALIPGDLAQAILGPMATSENVERLREEMSLDEPLPVQYADWAGGILSGDFGWSYSLQRPVGAELAERFPPTLLLAGTALLICAVVGLAVGCLMAIRQNTWTDRIASITVLVGISTPAFFLGLVFVLIFSIQLSWFPPSGMRSIFGAQGIADLLMHLFLPALTLGFVAAGVVARLTRSQMLEVLRLDYIRTARAKGLREPRVLFAHAFRNALVPMIPVIGLQAGFVLGGAVYVETIFQWPGLGQMLVTAISTRDLLLVQGGVLIVATSYVLINLGADVIQRLLDPRVEA